MEIKQHHFSFAAQFRVTVDFIEVTHIFICPFFGYDSPSAAGSL